MNHRIQAVSMVDCSNLEAVFMGGEVYRFDLRTMLSIVPQFQQLLKNFDLARKVQVDQGGYGVVWNDELDLDADTIWEEGIRIRIEIVDTAHQVANSLARAREYARLTQKQLSEQTGIYQADISKIESARGNPSLTTLQRLADGMGMDLEINFVPKKQKVFDNLK